MKKKNNRGFTLVELVVVMAIIGILSVIAVPTYRIYVQKAMAAEGVALVSGVGKSQMIHYSERGVYSVIPDSLAGEILNAGPGGGAVFNPRLAIDARTNTYFRGVSVTLNGAGFLVRSRGENNAAGIIVEYEMLAPDNPPKITVTYPM